MLSSNADQIKNKNNNNCNLYVQKYHAIASK